MAKIEFLPVVAARLGMRITAGVSHLLHCTYHCTSIVLSKLLEEFEVCVTANVVGICHIHVG